MLIQIGRSSGPSNDVVVESEFAPGDVNIIKGVIAMVNKATNNKERWFVQTPLEFVIPVVK